MKTTAAATAAKTAKKSRRLRRLRGGPMTRVMSAPPLCQSKSRTTVSVGAALPLASPSFAVRPFHACVARFHRLWTTLSDAGIAYNERLPYIATYVVRRSPRSDRCGTLPLRKNRVKHVAHEQHIHSHE